jgi:hypothetical protein
VLVWSGYLAQGDGGGGGGATGDRAHARDTAEPRERAGKSMSRGTGEQEGGAQSEYYGYVQFPH